MPRLLVLGGTGFLGGRVAAIGVDRGFDVTATRHSSTPDDIASAVAVFEHCDLTNRPALDLLIDTVAPDVVVNAAYIQSGPTASVVCGDAAGWVGEACARNRSCLIHISTDLVFDGSLGRPYTETDTPHPLSKYGDAKLRGEQLVAAAHPSAVIARTSLIYGDSSAPQETLVGRALDPTASGSSPIAFFTDEWRSPIHVDDLAAAVLDITTMLDHDSNVDSVLHVAGAERVSRLRFAQLLSVSLGGDPEHLVGRTQDPKLGPRPADVSLDISAALELGLTLPGASDRLNTSGSEPASSRAPTPKVSGIG